MRVIIVDDDALVVESLRMIVESKGFEVVATGKNGNDAINLSLENQSDVIMMDIRMEPTNGLEATREILKREPDRKILLITTFKDEEYIEEALKLGCKGYILKQNIKGIFPALEAVHQGQMVFDSQIVSIIPKALNTEGSNNTNNDAFLELNDREMDILKEISEGLSNKEISNKLHLSEGTVRNYISDMLLKLELRDRTQLAIYYLKNNK